MNWKYKTKNYGNSPPCLSHLPFIGSLYKLPNLSDLHKFYFETSLSFGNIFALYFCNSYTIVLNSRETIRNAFIKHSSCFSDRPYFYLGKYFDEINKGFVFHFYDDYFKKFHKVNLNILKSFGYGQNLMEERIKVEVDDLVSRLSTSKEITLDPCEQITKAVSNVICSILVGKRYKFDDEEFNSMIKYITDIMTNLELPTPINFFPFLRFFPYFRSALNKMRKDVESFNCLVFKIMDQIDKSGEKDNLYSLVNEEFLNNLEENYEGETKEEKLLEHRKQIMITLKDFLFAGTETTSSTLRWFLKYMANHQEVQERLREEIDRVVGRNRSPSLDDKLHLPLLEASMMEVMRVQTLVPLGIFHSTIEDVELEGFNIPKGTMVIPNIYSAHMDSREWEEPEKFKIERFLNEEQTEVINKDKIIPFSLGKRSCFGEMLARQELFLFSSSFIQNFKIFPPDGKDKIECKAVKGTVWSPEPYQIKFEKR